MQVGERLSHRFSRAFVLDVTAVSMLDGGDSHILPSA